MFCNFGCFCIISNETGLLTNQDSTGLLPRAYLCMLNKNTNHFKKKDLSLPTHLSESTGKDDQLVNE